MKKKDYQQTGNNRLSSSQPLSYYLTLNFGCWLLMIYSVSYSLPSWEFLKIHALRIQRYKGNNRNNVLKY